MGTGKRGGDKAIMYFARRPSEGDKGAVSHGSDTAKTDHFSRYREDDRFSMSKPTEHRNREHEEANS